MHQSLKCAALRSKVVCKANSHVQVDSEGNKFGKSEGGAIWLSAEKLSPYKFYQYLFKTIDADVIRMLRMLTFLPLEQIAELETRMENGESEANAAQRLLAEEVTRFVHGEEGVQVCRHLLTALSLEDNAVQVYRRYAYRMGPVIFLKAQCAQYEKVCCIERNVHSGSGRGDGFSAKNHKHMLEAHSCAAGCFEDHCSSQARVRYRAGCSDSRRHC